MGGGDYHDFRRALLGESGTYMNSAGTLKLPVSVRRPLARTDERSSCWEGRKVASGRFSGRRICYGEEVGSVSAAKCALAARASSRQCRRRGRKLARPLLAKAQAAGFRGV